MDIGSVRYLDTQGRSFANLGTGAAELNLIGVLGYSPGGNNNNLPAKTDFVKSKEMNQVILLHGSPSVS